MKPTSVVLLALGSVLTAAGCAPSPAPVAEVRQAGTLSQGTLSQGTLSQGTLSQGTLSQGTENAVWGFHREDWENERHGWTMVHGGVDKGHLIAEWGQTLNQFCWSGNTGVNRECRWLAGGAASCTRNNRETETVKVGVGGCGIGSASRAAYLRVCPGGKPCTHEQVIAASDHATTAPGKLCGQSELPSVSFQCPPEGRFFVMVGPQDPYSNAAFNFSVATSPARTFTKRVLDHDDFVDTKILAEDGAVNGEAAAHPRTYIVRSSTEAIDDATGETRFYQLFRADLPDVPLCLGGDQRAIPLQGRWDAQARWAKYDTQYFTFACPQGVLAKCYMHMKYIPWSTFPRTNWSLEDYFQTCTRAARADYCEDGRSFTVDNTIIDLWDRQRYNRPDTSLPVEAVWVREDTGEFPDQRSSLCLAKMRWDTMAFNGPCVDITPDPRTYPGLSEDALRPRYCDEKSVDINDPNGWFANPDVLEVNQSAFIDVGLWSWTRHFEGRTEKQVTTTITTTENPGPDYDYTPLGTPPTPVFLGALYRPRSSKPVRPSYATVALCSFVSLDGRDHRLARCRVNENDEVQDDEPPAGYQPHPVLEGFANALHCELGDPPCPTAKALRSYHIGSDYIVDLDGTTLPAGAQGPEFLGYLPR